MSTPGQHGNGRGAGARLRILGIDPGTVRLGYGVVDVELGSRGRHIVYIDCGVLAASARATREERLLIIGKDLRELLLELAPNVVAMEQAFFGKNVQATLALGEARGMALFVAQEHGATLAGYPPARVKQTVTGRGAATKEQVAFFVRAALKLRRTPSADAADALALALCHARLAGAPPGLLTATEQRPRRPRTATAGARAKEASRR